MGKKDDNPKACGVLCFRHDAQTGRRQFLLMKHDWRLDLPKGHIKKREDERDGALRELEEETGIRPQDITLDPHFRYETSRDVSPPYLAGRTVHKTYVFFAGEVAANFEVRISEEHIGYDWYDWQPPHAISAFLIDEILAAYATYIGDDEV